jgi:hypothetical protein
MGQPCGFQVLETSFVEGARERARFAGGWTSMRGGDGTVILEALGAAAGGGSSEGGSSDGDAGGAAAPAGWGLDRPAAGYDDVLSDEALEIHTVRNLKFTGLTHNLGQL